MSTQQTITRTRKNSLTLAKGKNNVSYVHRGKHTQKSKFALFIFCFFYFFNSSIEAYASNAVIDIIAPSSRRSPQNLESIKKYVEKLGFQGNISEDIYSTDNPFYTNSDTFRANDLIKALTSDDSKIIWCINGGSGASRLIPYLEKMSDSQKAKVKQHKKVLIGYSDITALHLYLQMKFDWQLIHGPMLEIIYFNEVAQNSIDKLTALISGNQTSVKFNHLRLINSDVQLKNKLLKSKIIGGNLTLIENGIGTVWQINTKGKILFLENTGWTPSQIERSLDHLKQAQLFNGVHAVIFGDFTDAGKDDTLVELVKQRFAQSVNFPVFSISGIGHGYTNDPLPLNADTIIKPQKDGLFSMDIEMQKI